VPSNHHHPAVATAADDVLVVAHHKNEEKRKEMVMGGRGQGNGLASYCGPVEEEVAFLLEVEKVEVVVLEQHSSNPLL
jgi:hypothetical protein